MVITCFADCKNLSFHRRRECVYQILMRIVGLMETIQMLWIVIFLFFLLILLYIWSKITIIHKRLRKVESLMRKNDHIIHDPIEIDDDEDDDNFFNTDESPVNASDEKVSLKK